MLAISAGKSAAAKMEIATFVGFDAKFFLWGENDVVITSLNMGSAIVNPDVPLSELGVHFSGPMVASRFVDMVIHCRGAGVH
ncbi:hypothetical protein [Rhizobium leguminosarum]|uniref:hypothetical protein n=1 Tax=Rhizobium leguminosarum TaxID=384 RepID=UPI000480BAA2|nr:hypothetical protein [Rhizobium leguminosarum]